MLTLIIVAALQSGAVRIGSDLSPGLQLHYTAGEQFTSPWIVDSVIGGVALIPGADCARFTIRRGEQAPNESRLCVRRDTLFSWDARRSEWTPQRPVGPRMTMLHARPNGDTVRYVTDTLGHETISAMRVAVLPTTVLTVDSLGRAKRRLRERYAISLATATGGTFEVPDSSSPGAWRAEQIFELRRIVPINR
jgi:hypothetical protein